MYLVMYLLPLKYSKRVIIQILKFMDTKEIKGMVDFCKAELSTSTNTIVYLQNNFDIHYNMLDSVLNAVASDLRKSRNIFMVKINKDHSLSIFTKPCKEFFKLSTWLGKYAKISLPVDRVSRQNVFGKRNWYEVTSESFLCYNPNRCKSYLEKLRKIRSSKDIFKCKDKCDPYYGDRFNSYGEDMESEWDGCITNTSEIVIDSPTGRKKGYVMLSCC